MLSLALLRPKLNSIVSGNDEVLIGCLKHKKFDAHEHLYGRVVSEVQKKSVKVQNKVQRYFTYVGY